MGKTISIAEESAKLQHHHHRPSTKHRLSSSASASSCSRTCNPSSNIISRSSSSTSISQLTNTSIASQQSTTSISHRFVSYDNDDTLIRIAPNNNGNRSQSWHLKLVHKYSTDCLALSPLSPPCPSSPSTDYIVFGLCDAALLELGYKHKYYSHGYSVTYCHGFKFESYSDAFPVDTRIVLKYEADTRQLTFWCNGQRKSRAMHIPCGSSHEYVVTVKAYCEQCEIEMI
eukprot:CAMPEP_0197073030 /NCGR_PEP_ID=MMETSP1384-20130603/210397_1 /TAXON_ID=29189 /ORGANISM="Ammonia sp." /LENGTH=228 /DNA_ID=CAMNT_0042511855 /DNA_START=38 /DNA_END=724 /DNA_ORIENTATION=+